MKRFYLSVIAVVLFAAVAMAQPAQCRVNATIYKPSGAPDAAFTLTVFRIVFAGQVYSNARQTFRSNASGVLLGADNSAGVSLPQGSVVWLYGNAPGFDFNPNNGTAFQIPNTSTAQLTALASATTVFRALGDLVYGGVDGIPTRLPAGVNGRCLVMVSGIPTWTVCPGGGGGASIWGGISGTLADQTDLQSALDAKANSSHTHAISAVTGLQAALDAKANTADLAAVAVSGLYNDLTGKPTLGTAAALNVAASGNAASGEVVKGNDTRLSDARTPTSHTHASTDISDSTSAGRALLTGANAAAQRTALGLGTAAVLNVAASGNAASGEVVKGDDTRLADARTPTSHTHAAADTISGTFDAARIPDLSSLYSVLAHSHTFASLTSKPTTLSGYGITDAQSLDQDLTDIAALTANGLLRRTGGVWAMDSASYLVGNQTITLSGDISGSGSTAITTTIGAGKVTNAMLAGSISNANLANSAITIAGNSTSLGGSISASTILDSIGSTRGSVLYRGASGWAILTPGTPGHVLTSNGSGADPTYQAVSGGGTGANPTASVGLSAVNGVAPTFMRSDAAPALDQSIAPTWTGAHIWSGNAQTIKRDSLGVTNATGLELTNTTAAAAGAQQISPDMVWTGAGWKTTSTAASQAVNFRAYALPVQGTTAPSVNWVLQSQVNGGGYTNRLSVTSAGVLNVHGGQIEMVPGLSLYGLASGGGGYVDGLRLAWAGSDVMALTTNKVNMMSGAVFSWSSTGASSGTPDSALARPQAATIRVQGSSSTTAATLSTPALSPSQITADQNNYAPGTGWFMRLSSDASRNLTGLIAGTDGQIAEIWNVGSNNIVIQDESSTTASTAANRFLTSTAADLTVTPKKCAELRYDGTSARWRVRLCN